MKRFCKTKDCPSSQNLLAFQLGEIGSGSSLEIRRHFPECEFCDIEAEFYALYPPLEETPCLEKIPRPLFELADALLRRKQDLKPLYNLIGAE